MNDKEIIEEALNRLVSRHSDEFKDILERLDLEVALNGGILK